MNVQGATCEVQDKKNANNRNDKDRPLCTLGGFINVECSLKHASSCQTRGPDSAPSHLAHRLTRICWTPSRSPRDLSIDANDERPDAIPIPDQPSNVEVGRKYSTHGDSRPTFQRSPPRRLRSSPRAPRIRSQTIITNSTATHRHIKKASRPTKKGADDVRPTLSARRPSRLEIETHP